MNTTTKLQKGKKFKVFGGKKRPIVYYILDQWAGLTIVIILLYLHFSSAKVFIDDFYFIGVALLITAYLAWSNYQRAEMFSITAYAKGLDIPNKGFFTWNVMQVEQEILTKLAPTVSFHPGYYIRLGNDKQTRISQTLADYQGLYKLLYENNVKGSEKPLYMYNVGIDGFKLDNDFAYTSVYYPKDGQLVKEKGIPDL